MTQKVLIRRKTTNQPVTLCPLLDKYPWKRHETPLSYKINSTIIVLLQGWLWQWITHKSWYTMKQRNQISDFNNAHFWWLVFASCLKTKCNTCHSNNYRAGFSNPCKGLQSRRRKNYEIHPGQVSKPGGGDYKAVRYCVQSCFGEPCGDTNADRLILTAYQPVFVYLIPKG